MQRIATARYLLREVEHAKRQTKEVAVEGTDRVHVEHIYPQTPTSKWSNHSSVLNRLGNLTLLSRRLNISIANSDFATKKLKGYAASDLLLTKELLSYQVWDTAAIDARQRDLSDWIFDIWKFPGEAAPASFETPKLTATPAPSTMTVSADAPESPDSLPEVPEG